MLITALGWNLKAWLALWLPEETPPKHSRQPSSPQRKRPASKSQPSEKRRLLGMEFRTFVNYFLRVPAQVVRSGRQTIVRLLAYNTWQPVFFRLAETLARPRRW